MHKKVTYSVNLDVKRSQIRLSFEYIGKFVSYYTLLIITRSDTEKKLCGTFPCALCWDYLASVTRERDKRGTKLIT